MHGTDAGNGGGDHWGALCTSSSQLSCSSAWKGLLVQSTAVVGDFQENDGFPVSRECAVVG